MTKKISSKTTNKSLKGGGKKDRCDRYKNKKTHGLPTNYVYRHCKKCPKNKTFRIFQEGNAYRNVRNACIDTESHKKSKQKAKDKETKCVSLKNVHWYGWKGFPCKGTSDEKKYRAYLNEEIKKFTENKMKHSHPESVIKTTKKEIQELNDFYKQKGGGKQNKQNKRTFRLSKWVLPTLPRSALKKMDSEVLQGYARLYKIKPCKGCEPYTDKDLIRELSRFIPSDKINKDYWDCIKKGKKSIGKYPFKSRNNTSKKFKEMSLHDQVKHTNQKIRRMRKKYKKEIDVYSKRSRKLYETCNKQREKQMKKQIKGK